MRNTFNSGKTRPIEFRINQLKKLREILVNHGTEIHEAMRADLRRVFCFQNPFKKLFSHINLF